MLFLGINALGLQVGAPVRAPMRASPIMAVDAALKQVGRSPLSTHHPPQSTPSTTFHSADPTGCHPPPLNLPIATATPSARRCRTAAPSST